MAAQGIKECAAEGYALTTIRMGDKEATLVEHEVRLGGAILGLVGRVGPQSMDADETDAYGFYALTAGREMLPGPFPRVLDACRALAQHGATDAE